MGNWLTMKIAVAALPATTAMSAMVVPLRI
jgi:hypothetical protein